MPARRGVCKERGNQSDENRYLNGTRRGRHDRENSGQDASDIPKGKIFDCMKEIRAVKVAAPVHIGDVIIDDCAGTGIAVVASKNVERA